MLGVRTSGKVVDSGNWQTLSGRNFNGNLMQKIGKVVHTVPSLRCLGLSTSILFLETRRDHPDHVQHDGQEWIKFNYDTGAFTTALLVELAEGFPCRKVGEFIVANGQGLPNFGRANFQTVDELVEGHVTDAHKPVASARRISKYHDAFIFEEFGALIPRQVSEGRQRVCHRLCELHCYHGILLLYREGRLYNSYLKRVSILEMAPVEPNQDTVMSEPANTSSSSSGTPVRLRSRKVRRSEQTCRPQSGCTS